MFIYTTRLLPSEVLIVNKVPNMELGDPSLNPTSMEQQIGFKLGKEYVKAVYSHPAYLIYMQSTSWETVGWMKHSWNQDCWEKYQ